MNPDVKYLDELMSIKNKCVLANNYFCWLYLFTNENIKEFYKKLDFKDKSVLTVTGSGDHGLNAFLHGAKDVSAFDINPLAKYLSELKIASIKSLTREEFIMFFNKKIGIIKNSKYFFDKKLYIKKIRKYLTKDYRFFWDYFISKYDNNKIRKSYLFIDDVLSFEGVINVNDYLINDENYYCLRELLKNKSIKYYDMDIKDITNINNTFDLIILSNVADYFEMFSSQRLKNFRELIDNLKKSDTKVVVNYIYGSSLLDDISLEKEFLKYFNNEEFELLYHDSVRKYNKKLLFKNTYSDDMVLISKNKKEEI